MARFWRRGEGRAIEHLLRSNRAEPDADFASSILEKIVGSSAQPTPLRTRSPRRLGLAVALAIVTLGIAGVLGGLSAASAGLGGIAHVATKAVSPAHTQSTSANTASSAKNEDKGNKADDNDNDNQGADEHQYKVGVCHWANHKYVLIFVSPQGAANHLAHHPNDKLPVNGHC